MLNEKQQELLKELPNLGTWHHHIELAEGITTSPQRATYNPEDRWNLIRPFIPDDLSGKTVLDLGCNSGYYSMKAKKLGAERVVAVDAFDNAIRQTKFISKWFDVNLEIVKEDALVYCLTTEEQFDYIFFLGLFYHQKYGILMFDRLAEMTKSKLYFESAVWGPPIPEFKPKPIYKTEERREMLTSRTFPKMIFIETSTNDDWTNWWFPNESAILSFLRNAKLKIISRPNNETFVCEPDNPLGKKVYSKLVFPLYGKPGKTILPP